MFVFSWKKETNKVGKIGMVSKSWFSGKHIIKGAAKTKLYRIVVEIPNNASIQMNPLIKINPTHLKKKLYYV